MKKSDFHVHTTFCDGHNTAEEMVLSAIENGLETIGFSGHGYVHFDIDYCMDIDQSNEYVREIERLKEKYKDKITIKCGIEQDYYTEYLPEGLEYKIGSVHYFPVGDDKYISIDQDSESTASDIEKYFDGDPYAYCEKYYELVSDVVNKTNCDIIGHFDLITKFNENGEFFSVNDERYISAWKNAADKLLATGKIFEINTGVISRGYRTKPYPAKDIIDYLKSKGAKFIMSGDSHSVDTLCYKFDEFAYLAED